MCASVRVLRGHFFYNEIKKSTFSVQKAREMDRVSYMITRRFAKVNLMFAIVKINSAIPKQMDD